MVLSVKTLSFVMMRHLYIIMIMLAAGSLYAQRDNPTGGIAIPKSNTTVTPTGPVSSDSPFSLSPPKKTNSTLQVGQKQNDFSMYKSNEFINRGSEFKDKANASIAPRGESNEAFRGNLDFGVIKTKSAYVVLRARDFGAQDGDRIKITLNDKTILSDVLLLNDTQSITITLSEGFNNIQFEALNQGTSGPNTGEFFLYDDEETRLTGGEWNLATGFHGKFVLVRE